MVPATSYVRLVNVACPLEALLTLALDKFPDPPVLQPTFKNGVSTTDAALMTFP